MQKLNNKQHIKKLCPKCRKYKTIKLGFKYIKSGRTQRFLCKNCGYVFY